MIFDFAIIRYNLKLYRPFEYTTSSQCHIFTLLLPFC
jgi:hypothetical protein